LVNSQVTHLLSKLEDANLQLNSIDVMLLVKFKEVNYNAMPANHAQLVNHCKLVPTLVSLQSLDQNAHATRNMTQSTTSAELAKMDTFLVTKSMEFRPEDVNQLTRIVMLEDLSN